MLFGQEANPEVGIGVTVTVIGLVITTLGNLGAAILTYLTNRSRLQFDADVALIRKGMADCEKERNEDRAKMDALLEEAETAKLFAAKLEGELAGCKREVVTLKEEVRELRDRLYGSKK